MKSKIIKIMVALLLILTCLGASVLTVSAAAPTNQNTVYTANKYKCDGASVSINSAGNSAWSVWFAPIGTTAFTVGPTMTEAGGTDVAIQAPAIDGTYYLYVINAGGEYSVASTHWLVTDSTPPTISVSLPSVSSTSTGPVTYTVTYADTNFYASTLNANNITLNKTGNAQCLKSVSGSGLTRTITLSSITGNGTIGISIVNRTGLDFTGNFTPAIGPSATFTVSNSGLGPTNEDAVFPSNVSTGNTNPVGIASAGNPTYTVWFAPQGTTVFAEGPTMTKAGGTDTSIYAPSQDGTYKLYVLDSSGDYSAPSVATLTDETAPLMTISAPDLTDLDMGNIYYTVTYTDTNFYASTLSEGTITINLTGTAYTTGISVVGTGNTRNLQLSGVSGNGTISITITNWTACDLVGNRANGATSDVTNVNR